MSSSLFYWLCIAVHNFHFFVNSIYNCFEHQDRSTFLFFHNTILYNLTDYVFSVHSYSYFKTRLQYFHFQFYHISTKFFYFEFTLFVVETIAFVNKWSQVVMLIRIQLFQILHVNTTIHAHRVSYCSYRYHYSTVCAL